MKHPFKRSRTSAKNMPIPQPIPPAVNSLPPDSPQISAPDVPMKFDDGFTEWCRSQTRGGIERRERNDFFEEYTVFGKDKDDALCCQLWHRYPEHEKYFDLSYSRKLTFEEFNRRLLSELDKGGVKLDEYHRCIASAEQLSVPDTSAGSYSGDLTDAEKAVLQEFCDSIDTFKNKTYLHSQGVLSCECESVAGGAILQIRFRKPLPHDAWDTEVPGVTRSPIEGYDIDDLWIMSFYNRLRERCRSCKVTKLSSAWSIGGESLLLMRAEGFDGIDGVIFAAVGSPSDLKRFGFYSLDFSAKK